MSSAVEGKSGSWQSRGQEGGLPPLLENLKRAGASPLPDPEVIRVDYGHVFPTATPATIFRVSECPQRINVRDGAEKTVGDGCRRPQARSNHGCRSKLETVMAAFANGEFQLTTYSVAAVTNFHMANAVAGQNQHQ